MFFCIDENDTNTITQLYFQMCLNNTYFFYYGRTLLGDHFQKDLVKIKATDFYSLPKRSFVDLHFLYSVDIKFK